MISSLTSSSLSNYLTVQNADTADGRSAATAANLSANAKAKASATAQAALQAASATHKSSVAVQALDKQQTTLASDMRAAMNKAAVKLSGSVEFSVTSNGTVSLKGSDADKAAMTAFLKADTQRPSFATRIASQAKNALSLSATIQQSAAISQAARYGGSSGGAMSLYTSLMQQNSASTAVFAVSAGSSSLTYPGSLTSKA